MEHFVWNINPTLFALGPLQLRWYGLLFVGSFFLGLLLLQWMYKREAKDPTELENFLLYIILGVVIGSRLVHCFFYAPDYYLSHPLEILMVWKGGLASHGGMLGAILAIYLFAKRYKSNFFWLLARTTIPGTITASFVRFGNFFNSEILGLSSQLPWAIVFQRVDMLPRHPVQLYEAFSYLFIFIILLFIYKKSAPNFATRILPGAFFFMLFTVRFFLEYTKTEQANYTTNLPFTTGQMLSIPFILLGIVWILWAFKNKHKVQKENNYD
ncbi:MAG: prolipoprotein diacylglyceryl transferase [Epsilonproteobacteria bacterium]|nr:MAG: prolipoprotein diacylglyceryl transferase [Campylobacterota bacterium]